MSLAELIKDIEQGFFVTELMGSSVSLITGDYSRGAGGSGLKMANHMACRGSHNRRQFKRYLYGHGASQ